MPALPPSIVASLSLIVGFAVADATGVRPLGGIVLFAGALWCGLRWKAQRGLPVAIGLIVVFLGLFAASHPLGKAIDTWPAVFTVGAAMALIGWLVADRHLAAAPAARDA